MGTCTSSVKHQEKQHRQLHKRPSLNNSIVLKNKQVSSLPVTVLPNQHPHSLLTNFDVQSSPLTEPIIYQTDTSSLIQLYSSNTNNNNNNNNNSIINNCMSSSSSPPSNIPPRIPVTKSRLPVHQPQSSSTGSIRPKIVPPTVGTTNPLDSIRPMSITNRPPLPPSSQNTTQTRFGFIPRPTAPGLQQAQASSFVARSRSISPASTNSANSSTSSVSQRLAKTQTIPKPTSNRPITPSSSTATNATKSKISPSSNNNKDSTTSKSTVTNRVRSKTLSQPSTTSPSTITPTISPTKTDVNAIRDRYKNQKRMNFFTRRTPLTTNSRKSSSIESSVIKEEKNEQSSTDEQTTSAPIESQNDDLKTEQASSSQGDSAYASIVLPSNHPPSAQNSQTNRQRLRTSSTLSSSSVQSDVRNQDAILDDDNCSLKSDDLICDYDDTLTLDSVSKNDQTDSCSSNSLSIETNKKPTMITTVPIKKPNIPPFQPVLKDHRTANTPKSSSIDKTNSNLLESLDELTRLSTRMENTVDNEHNRKLLSRSVSLKPPPTSLPPREDGEQITMDIESYRQVMKDVMVVKTILHQLDRLLKHSDGANMTDSMIGSFHESMINSRHFSSSSIDGNSRNSIDENSSFDDLFKEILILRKEREQDKQTIKLLQEQMYKYSSQTND